MTEESIKEYIDDRFHFMEEFQNVKILYAIESGSGAWGFKSVDSDIDVRFIYMSSLSHYLALETLDGKNDTLSSMSEDGKFDLHGWDIRKALKLLRNGNPNLLEWLASPILYRQLGNTAETMDRLANQYFNPRTSMHHYYNIAEDTYKKYLMGEQVEMKKYFYALRPILACEWTNRYRTRPPIEFEKLVNYCVDGGTVKQHIYELLDKKRAGKELGLTERSEPLQHFIVVKLESLGFKMRTDPKIKKPKVEWQLLNMAFEKAYKDAWGEEIYSRRAIDDSV